MKLTVNVLCLFFLSLVSYSQHAPVTERKFPFSDTTLFKVNLVDPLTSQNFIEVQNNKNVIIYLSEDSIRSITVRGLSNTGGYNKKEYKALLSQLNKLKFHKINVLSSFYSSALKYIISKQMVAGYAKVYDKQNKVYLKTMYQRIESVISTGYRTFYFSETDRRYLFTYAEWTGIFPNELMPDIE